MNRAPNGFTLLEVLVVLAVFGFVILEIGMGVGFGLRAATVQSRLLNRRADLDGMDRVMRYLMAHMEPGTHATPPQITGAKTSLSFTTQLPAGAVGELTRAIDARLFVSEGQRLVLRWTPHFHSGTPVDATPSEQVLLPDVKAIQFSYFYPDGVVSHGWTDQWSAPYLPRLVRVHLSFADGDAQRWPDMIMEPAQDTPRE